MKTYFIELVFNNESKKYKGTMFLRGIIYAKNLDAAKEKFIKQYESCYTGGDEGEFKIQCAWEVKIPTREFAEKYWKAICFSVAPMRVGTSDHDAGYDYVTIFKTKKDIIDLWRVCNVRWASVPVAYNPKYGGYTVSVHNYMMMEHVVKVFKGSTKTAYDKAIKFVKENTFKGDYYSTPVEDLKTFLNKNK